jgi:SPP1 family predicted phage head-tail adaptor
MRAGNLDRVIALQRNVESKSSTGAITSAWTNFATMRSEIVQQSAGEFLTGFGEAETTAIIFRVRYIVGITTADRIVYAGNAYDLDEIKEIGRRRGLELRCERAR